jgi:hypothetical protein
MVRTTATTDLLVSRNEAASIFLREVSVAVMVTVEEFCLLGYNAV